MDNEELLSFYGAKPSRSGKGYNVTLVRGHDGKKEFLNVYAKGERCREKDGVVWVSIKLLGEKKEAKPEDLPF